MIDTCDKIIAFYWSFWSFLIFRLFRTWPRTENYFLQFDFSKIRTSILKIIFNEFLWWRDLKLLAWETSEWRDLIKESQNSPLVFFLTWLWFLVMWTRNEWPCRYLTWSGSRYSVIDGDNPAPNDFNAKSTWSMKIKSSTDRPVIGIIWIGSIFEKIFNPDSLANQTCSRWELLR